MRDRIGKFKLLNLLGQGTMGEVYLAKDDILGRPVALKVISASNSFGGESQARFEREARALASLNHPHVVTLYEFGIEEGTPYLAMEYLEGEDLGTLMERAELGKPVLLEILAQVCDGLGQAHAQGLVHRDVKPANIRVVMRNGRPQAKLMDFGIASEESSSLTQKGAWMGTVSYMAPEYLESGLATPSSDLFAIGIMLYEILSGGRKPFKGDSAPSILAAILGKSPDPLTPEERVDVPTGMVAVLDRALSKDPAVRFPSAEALAEAIRAALAEPAKAPAPVATIFHVGGGPKPYLLSLRVALRRATAGSEILVHPGSYREALVVDKEVTVRAVAPGVILEGGVTVQEGVALSLRGVSLGNSQGAGLVVARGAALEAEDCEFKARAAGVELRPESRGSFANCRFEANGFAGLLALESSQATLEGCQFRGNQDAGVHACGGSRLHLGGCQVVGNPGLGVSAVDGADLNLEQCEISGNGEPGLLLHRQASAKLMLCGVTEGHSLGILCLGGSRLELEGCRVQSNAKGSLRVDVEGPQPVLGPGNQIDS